MIRAVLLAIGIVSSGCLLGPMDGDQIQDKWTPVRFSGFAPTAMSYGPPKSTDKIPMAAYNNQTNTWDFFADVHFSGGSGIPQTGTQFGDLAWYLFDTTTSLPTASKYWSFNNLGKPTIRLSATQNVAFYFDRAQQQCVTDTFNATAEPFHVIDSCSSGKRELSLSVPCGDSGQDCCYGTDCKSGLSCNRSSKICGPKPNNNMPTPLPPGSTTDPCPGVGESCTVHPSECGAGFMATGVKKCINRKLTCVAQAQVNYCNHCGNGCGECFGANNCSPTFPCQPGYVCAGSGDQHQCIAKPECPGPRLGCWQFNEVGSCQTSPMPPE